MATKKITPKTASYGEIQRGTSLSIPVRLVTQDDLPVDISGCKVAFTVKRKASDFDAYDRRAFIAKDLEPQQPMKGKFHIDLTSDDTNFEPGEFYFDIELYKENGAVCRLVTLNFSLVGGPTNRTVNPNEGQLAVGDEVTVITLTEGAPIVVIAPVSFDSTLMEKVEGVYALYCDIWKTTRGFSASIAELEMQLEVALEKIKNLEALLPSFAEDDGVLSELLGKIE